MTRKIPPQKRLEMIEIGQKYDELKAMRRVRRQEYEAQLELDMEQARKEFGIYLQSKVDRTNMPYKFTVSDIMSAMGTSDRNTVNKFLGDARERARNRYLDDFKVEVLGLELVKAEHLYGANQSDIYEATVLDRADNSTWLATLQNLKNRYTIYQIDEQGETIFNEWAGKKFPRPLADTAPEWLKWLNEQDEWLEKLEEK